MAIAYFIPDQAKLLARSASNQSSNASANSTGAAVNSNQSGGNTTTIPPSMSQQQPQQQQPQPHHNNHHFRANITIPLAAYDTPQMSVGCWELITHVFCYALRCYHETERSNPTAAIKISFEISGDVATPSATQQQQQQQEPTTGPHRNTNGAPNKN